MALTLSWLWLHSVITMVKMKKNSKKIGYYGKLPPLAPHRANKDRNTAAETFHKHLQQPQDLGRRDV